MDTKETLTEKHHGTPGGYTNQKCRGACCRTAWAAYTRTRRQSRKAKV